MKTITYTLTGLFLLSLLLVATSFASEAVIPHSTYGLQPYVGTASGSTGLSQAPPTYPSPGYGKGLTPAWETTSRSTESDMGQPLRDPDNTLNEYGIQPAWGSTRGSSEFMEPEMGTR